MKSAFNEWNTLSSFFSVHITNCYSHSPWIFQALNYQQSGKSLDAEWTFFLLPKFVSDLCCVIMEERRFLPRLPWSCIFFCKDKDTERIFQHFSFFCHYFFQWIPTEWMIKMQIFLHFSLSIEWLEQILMNESLYFFQGESNREEKKVWQCGRIVGR
jgi:hypothetical protein